MALTIIGESFCEVQVPKGKTPQTLYYEQMFERRSTHRATIKIRERFQRVANDPELDVDNVRSIIKKQNKKIT